MKPFSTIIYPDLILYLLSIILEGLLAFLIAWRLIGDKKTSNKFSV